MRLRRPAGRHRLGKPGLVHCHVHTQVAVALKRRRRPWFAAMLTPARHSLAGIRRSAAAAATERAWAPLATGWEPNVGRVRGRLTG